MLFLYQFSKQELLMESHYWAISRFVSFNIRVPCAAIPCNQSLCDAMSVDLPLQAAQALKTPWLACVTVSRLGASMFVVLFRCMPLGPGTSALAFPRICYLEIDGKSILRKENKFWLRRKQNPIVEKFFDEVNFDNLTVFSCCSSVRHAHCELTRRTY